MKKIKVQRLSSMRKGQIRYWHKKIIREMSEKIAKGLEKAIIYGVKDGMDK